MAAMFGRFLCAVAALAVVFPCASADAAGGGTRKMCLVGFADWEKYTSIKVEVSRGMDPDMEHVLEHVIKIGDSNFGAYHFAVSAGDKVTVSASGEQETVHNSVTVKEASADGSAEADSLSLEGGPTLVFLVSEMHHIGAYQDFVHKVKEFIDGGAGIDSVLQQMPVLWRKVEEDHAGFFITVLGDGFESDRKPGKLPEQLALKWRSDMPRPDTGKKQTKTTKMEVDESGAVFGLWTVQSEAGRVALTHTAAGKRDVASVAIKGPSFPHADIGSSGAKVFFAVHGSKEASNEFLATVQQAIKDPTQSYWVENRWNEENLVRLWALLNGQHINEHHHKARDPLLHAVLKKNIATAVQLSDTDGTEQVGPSKVHEPHTNTVVGITVAMIALLALGYFCCCSSVDQNLDLVVNSHSESAETEELVPSMFGEEYPMETVKGLEKAKGMDVELSLPVAEV